MPIFEYKVVPAPEKGQKGKGVKGPRERFANALQSLMNDLGAAGWEYVRADTLPCEERSGLTGSTTTYQNVLVFRREKASDVALLEAPKAPDDDAQAKEDDAQSKEYAHAKEIAARLAKPPAATQPTAPPVQGTDAAAASAAAAALTAYRDSTSGAPKLGPAPERHPERDVSAE